jgi:hypothetical protein
MISGFPEEVIRTDLGLSDISVIYLVEEHVFFLMLFLQSGFRLHAISPWIVPTSLLGLGRGDNTYRGVSVKLGICILFNF